jgi:aminoglycoside phosphotransferase (APT) family kinase protein
VKISAPRTGGSGPVGAWHAERIETLERSVRAALGEASLTVRPWRSGLDFWADLAETDSQLAVLRSPRTEVLQTSYEGVVDYGAIVEREVEALRLMSKAGIPVPRVLGWQRAQRAGEASWVLLSYVQHDEAADIPMTELGELTRRLHAIQPNRPGLTVPESWSGFVWSRLSQRLGAARAYCDIPAEEQLQPGVTALLESRDGAARSLLHMDLRAPNLCIRDGRIAAIIDVANCVVGDPLLELGRLRRYGLLTDAFLSGYGLVISDLNADELALLDVYELDTAALLTVVAVEEVDDVDLHKLQAARTEYLAAQLARRFLPGGQ